LDFKKSQGFPIGQTRPKKHAFFEKIHTEGKNPKDLTTSPVAQEAPGTGLIREDIGPMNNLSIPQKRSP
jgi:hypothetical protein